MKNSRLILIIIVLMAGVFMVPTLGHTQETWMVRLARQYKDAIFAVQKVCIEMGKVECQLVGVEQDPPFLFEGQVFDYINVIRRGFLYIYLVVAEREDMDPDIYLFDSYGRLLAQGREVGPTDLAFYKPEYTQRVIARIKMYRGSGHIAVAALAPVESY
jgi:hypothetical protein